MPRRRDTSGVPHVVAESLHVEGLRIRAELRRDLVLNLANALYQGYGFLRTRKLVFESAADGLGLVGGIGQLLDLLRQLVDIAVSDIEGRHRTFLLRIFLTEYTNILYGIYSHFKLRDVGVTRMGGDRIRASGVQRLARGRRRRLARIIP
ncbi:protein of unknown function (plasmid) [Shinella sp. WSC3-e]|nr:hypothetical protein SHINE37_90128 [Rhizobiaceae bacterium]CAK7262345.1 protein of unknown function [Shinella sp. WSC3-e]